MSVFGFGHEVVTSTTKPANPSVGQLIYCSDTDEYLKYVNYGGANRWMQAVLKPGRNMVYNSQMAVAQRATSVGSISSATSLGYYTADRWDVYAVTAGTWTQDVVSDAPTIMGAAKSLRMTCNVANGSLSSGSLIRIRQKFEGQDMQRIRKGTASAVPVTLSFWVKSNAPGTYVCGFYDYVNSRTIASTYTINATATWEYKSVTFAGDTTGAITNNTSAGMQISFDLAAGSGFNGTLATSWAADISSNIAGGQSNLAAAVNNYWQITGVQLEIGTAPSEYEYREYGDELRRCQRYYEQVAHAGRYYSNDGYWGFNFSFKVTKRAADYTMTVVSTGNSSTFSSVGAVQNTIQAANYQASGLAAGMYYAYGYTVGINAEI